MNRWRYAAKQDLKTGFINVIHQYLLVLQRNTVFRVWESRRLNSRMIFLICCNRESGLFWININLCCFVLIWAIELLSSGSWVANFSWLSLVSRDETWNAWEFLKKTFHFANIFLLLFLQRKFFNRGAVFSFIRNCVLTGINYLNKGPGHRKCTKCMRPCTRH